MEQEALLIALIAAYLHGKTLDGEPYRSIGIPALLALSKRWSLEVMALDALEAQQIFHREELKAWTEAGSGCKCRVWCSRVRRRG